MFGFGLKSKAKRVIREEFFYEVSYINEPTFNAIYQQGKMIGQNEYSIAIFYMFVMMNVLLENINSYYGGKHFSVDRSSLPDDELLKGNLIETEEFIKKHTANLNRIIHQANSPESEIRTMHKEISEKLSQYKRNKLTRFLSKKTTWENSEIENEVRRLKKEHEISGSEAVRSEGVYELLAKGNLAKKLIQAKYEEMLRDLSFAEIIRKLDVGETNEIKNPDIETVSMAEDNKLALSDDLRSQLFERIMPFSACIMMSQVFIMSEIEDKNLNITEIEIGIIRSLQLLGALDYIGQGENIDTDQLIEPFISIVKDEPYKIGMDISSKILNMMSNPTTDIINVQINGAKLLEKVFDLIPKGKEKFSSGMITIARENASELTNLISQPLITKIRNILK